MQETQFLHAWHDRWKPHCICHGVSHVSHVSCLVSRNERNEEELTACHRISILFATYKKATEHYVAPLNSFPACMAQNWRDFFLRPRSRQAYGRTVLLL